MTCVIYSKVIEEKKKNRKMYPEYHEGQIEQIGNGFWTLVINEVEG